MKKVAIFGQIYKTEHQGVFLLLVKTLIKHKIEVAVNESYLLDFYQENNYAKLNVTMYHKENPLNDSFDAMVTLGGDGTILRAFNLIQNLNIPVLGINLGRLGFLATVQRDEIEAAVGNLVKGQYKLEARVVLKVNTKRDNEEEQLLGYALNDFTITKKDTNSMIGVEAFLNNEYLTTYWADGLIVSTPTGSTGYSLSCQGPVMMPDTQNMLLTPVAPHNLNARPIVISDQTQIKLKILRREDHFLASLDSKVQSIDVDTELIVSKADYTAKLISLQHHTFINTLRDKLLWGHDMRNKGMY